MPHRFAIRLLVCTFVFLSLCTLLPSAAYAQPITSQDCFDLMSPDADPNGCKTADEELSSKLNSLACYIGGCKTSEGKSINLGMMPYMTSAITYALVNPPVHAQTYFADAFRNISGAQPVYAQGIGFTGLSPVLQIWKAFRNLAYFIYIIIFVVIGFMIMFRQQVGHNVVVTVQEALPKLIITLILITFSYAIAGLLVDMIYVSIFMVTALFEQFKIFNPGGGAIARNLIFSKNIISVGLSLFIGTEEVAGEASQAVASVIEEAFGGWLVVGSVIAGGVTGGVLSKLNGKDVGLGLFSGAVVGAVLPNILIYLIITISIIIALFRTFLQLVTAFVNIILSVIFAPLMLLMGAIPGNESGFGTWFKGIFANVAIFPVVVCFILIGGALTGGQNNSGLNNPLDPDINNGIWPTQQNVGYYMTHRIVGGGGTSHGWVPPLVLGGSAQTSTNAVRAIIGFGMIMLLPEIVKITHKALGHEDAGYGEMAMKNSTAGWGPLTFIPRWAQGEQARYDQQLYEWQLHGSVMGKEPHTFHERGHRMQAATRLISSIFGLGGGGGGHH